MRKTPDPTTGLRRRFLAGEALPSGSLDDAVLRSWQRLREGAPARPLRSLSPVLFQLREAAEPEVERLAHTASGAGYTTLLTDVQGVVLCRAGPPVDGALQVGADVSEARIGTNAMTNALVEARPARVSGAEHGQPSWQRLDCLAAPVFDPCGNAIGALAIVRTGGAGGLAPMALVVAAAQAIERRLVGQVQAHLTLELGLAQAPPGAMAWVCLDAGGAVLALNHGARHLLGWGAGRPDRFEDLFEARARPWLARLRQAPDGLALRSRDGLLLWARVLVPTLDGAPARTLAALSQDAMIQALAHAHGNVSAAARQLGISRATLYRRLKRP
ncbi:MAG: hypothetical protein LCH73_07955 [Proteobacteria bacterium]|nr:hypothetical protein [Pseudomonadota bacterium]